MIRKHDLFGIVETRANESSELKIKSCRHFVKYGNKSGNRNYGGIALYINNRIRMVFLTHQIKTKMSFGANWTKNISKQKKDIYLGTVYLSPSKFERKQNADTSLS